MPSYKIGSSKREDTVPKERMNGPDPGKYQPDDSFVKRKGAAYGFGTSGRESNDGKVPKPGPSTYDLPPKAFDKVKFAMGIKPKEIKSIMTPGPGDYDSNPSSVKKGAPAFTMSGRYMQDKPKIVPCPTEYAH